MARTLICGHSRSASIFLTTVLFFMMAFLLVGGNRNNAGMMQASLVYLVFMTVLAYLLFRSGRVHRYRSIFFSVYAIAFVLNFIPILLETRGHIALTGRDIANLDTPLCHLTIPMLILPGLVYGVLIFPTKLFANMGFYPMLFLWLGATVVLGKGWCSWGCFYGGLDEFFSKLLPKRIVSSRKFNYSLRWFPFALLLVIVVWSFLALDPVYCTWLCPFKTITEFAEVTDLPSYLAMLLFVILFFGLAIVLPILTRKRVQCMSLCPFGAFQSLTGKIAPYRVRIDRSKCVDCGACVAACPTLSLDEESVRKGKTLVTCTLCGECLAACPKGAIDYAFGWSRACGTKERLFEKTRSRIEASAAASGRRPGIGARFALGALRTIDELLSARILMITCGYIFGCILGGSFASGTILRLWNLLSTGSFALK